MKKCPFCGANIEDSARFCLYCMQPLTEKEQILLHKKKKPQWLLIIAAIVAILLMLVMIWCSRQLMLESGASSQDPSLNTSSPSQTESSDPPVTEPPHIHSYSVANTAIEYQKEAATCTAPALFYYSCACGEKGSNTFSHGEPAEHAIVTDPGRPADCVNTGLTEGSHCSVCNTIFLVQTQLPVVPHTFDNNRDNSCNVCNYIRVINCDHVETIQLAAVSPTCTASGLTAGKKCALCEELLVAQSIIAAKGHAEVIDPAIAATCTTTGKTEGKHCSTCNAVLLAQVTVAAKGHTEVIDPAIAATCTSTGKTEGKHCATCNVVLVAQTSVAAKGHTEVIDQAVSPTCTTPGKTEGIYCSVCNAVIKPQTTVNALGHTEIIDAAIPATCTTPGKTEGTHCSVCQTVLSPQLPLLELGHKFALGDSSCTCLDCGSIGTTTINAPQFPHFVNNTYRINSGTWRIRQSRSGKWQIVFTFNYTNISSNTTALGPDVYLRGISSALCSGGSLDPNETDTFQAEIYITDPDGTYELVFN